MMILINFGGGVDDNGGEIGVMMIMGMKSFPNL